MTGEQGRADPTPRKRSGTLHGQTEMCVHAMNFGVCPRNHPDVYIQRQLFLRKTLVSPLCHLAPEPSITPDGIAVNNLAAAGTTRVVNLECPLQSNDFLAASGQPVRRGQCWLATGG
mgnify:CR=1 FL=1